jgi:hypothetical protein
MDERDQRAVSLDVAGPVASLLGPAVASHYRQLPLDDRPCLRCGELIGTEPAALAVHIDRRPAGLVASIEVSHGRCAPSQLRGDTEAPLAPAAGTFAAISRASRPRALAVIDRPYKLVDATGAGAAAELRTATLLGAGFARIAGRLPSADGPRLDRWKAAYRRGRLQVSCDADVLLDRRVALTDTWSRMAGTDEEIVVVTGAHIGLGDAEAPAAPERLAQAVEAGQVTAARIPWSPAPPPGRPRR